MWLKNIDTVQISFQFVLMFIVFLNIVYIPLPN